MKADELMERVALCPEGVRDWAAREGQASLKARIDTAGVIAAQAATLQTMLLGGVGGALALGARVFEPDAGPVAYGAAVLCLYWMGVAVYVGLRCMIMEAAPMLNNEPRNLLLPGASLEALQMGELVNVQERIDQQFNINDRRARALNRARLAAVAGPLVFVLAAACARLAG